MTWFILSLLSITSLAAAELIQQKVLKSGKGGVDERNSTVLTYLLPITLVYLFIMLTEYRTGFLSVFRREIFLYLALSSFTASAGVYFYLKSFKTKNISFSLVFISLSSVVSTMLGIIFFGESTHFLKFVGIGLIIGSIASLNYKNSRIEKNNLYGLIAGLFFGITFTLDKLIVLDTNPIVYLFWSFLLVTIGTFFLNPRAVIRTIKVIKFVEYKPLMISGLGFLLFNLFAFFAYTYGGEVGRVDAINNTEIFLVILAEFFIFKHKDDVKRKLLTAFIAFVGVLLLGVF